MRPLLTPDEMTAADRLTIEGGTPAEVLMDRAGRAVARVAIQLAGGRYGRRAVVVCGKGNNGGDGFVVARVLRSEGLGVRCLFVGDAASVQGPARHHMERLSSHGVAVEVFDEAHLAEADVVIDALFGTGFTGAVTGEAEAAIAAIDGSLAPVLAVDIPSGVNGATGAVTGRAVRADVTVALGAQKLGTAVGKGAAHAGIVEVADIGIEVGPTAGATGVSMSSRSDIANLVGPRDLDSHKRSRGSVVIVGGSAGMSGAVVLAARGAMRAGAGYVTAGVTEAVAPVIAAAVPEVLTRVLTTEDQLGADALEELKPVLERATALAIGPGLGHGAEQRALVEAVVAEVDLPIVIDADGLNVLAEDTTLLRERTWPCVLTPHPAELARLLSTTVAAVQDDRIAAVRSAAAGYGCIVVLKGFRSLIAGPDGIVVNPTGGPSLATAGTGDVLTGVTAAFLASGIPAFGAATAAAYVHGLAGSLAAETLGDEGVVAWDVAEAIAEATAQAVGQVGA